MARYGNDPGGCSKAAEALGGEPMDLADAAYKFSAFPRVPLYYLFWEGDQKFPSNLSLLFDDSIEKHLAADATWGLVNLISNLLISGGDKLKPQKAGYRSNKGRMAL